MKIITVPKNQEAQHLLNYDKCPSDQLDEVFLSQEQFDKLWHLGLFAKINKISGCLIDDYESEEITEYKDIKRALAYIQSNKWPENVQELICKVEQLFIKARDYSRFSAQTKHPQEKEQYRTHRCNFSYALKSRYRCNTCEYYFSSHSRR